MDPLGCKSRTIKIILLVHLDIFYYFGFDFVFKSFKSSKFLFL